MVPRVPSRAAALVAPRLPSARIRSGRDGVRIVSRLGVSLLRHTAERLTEELTDDGLGAAIDAARLMARDLLDPSSADEVVAGLRLVEEGRAALVGLTVGSAASVLVLMAARADNAVPAWLSYHERRALHHRSTDAAVLAGDEAAERAAALQRFVLRVGRHLLTRLLPFLLASL